MLELLEKLMYAGVGAMAVTEEKAKALVSELEKKGHVTSDEGKKLVKDLVEKGRQHSDEIKKTVSTEVKKTLDNLHVVKKEDFDALRTEVRDLSAKIDMLLAGSKN